MPHAEISVSNLNRPVLKTPWAILVCRFKDKKDVPFTIQDYQTMFTAMGVGSLNMVDYFRDVSHQLLDLSDSKVFGPIVLDQNRSDYKGHNASDAGRQARKDFFAAARQKAIDSGVRNLSDFSNRIVVCVNVPTEYWGGATGVLCDSTSVRPAVMGQEMGHVYGLDHSKADGSTAEYGDPWDVMSNDNIFEASHPNPKFQNMGPILNAANMAGRDWLDENRVWNVSSPDFDTVIQLRPLVRYDLPGFLAARIGEFLVEFRVNKGWDGGILEPAVLVHRFEDNTSYLMRGKNGRQDLIAGASFVLGDPRILGSRFSMVEVVAIDANADTATIRLARHSSVAVRPPPSVAGPEIILGGVPVDGEGIVIFGGKIVRVPPRSPVLKILQKIVELDASTGISKAELRSAVRRDAYAEIASHAELQRTQLTDTFQPAPPVRTDKPKKK